ncbi:hypothetical protein [Nostoc sp. TCL26-01]|uniref:hypothetical protein n=1 Tax=Nostoc sp. TCL26-01 TaxID=2576904 RepID=UPI0015B7D052|nr:hypothetical protein [Nostoc sp. TCL26-01]QLE58307.1 hypothetical protein FD725_24015 [Nostoc sp. TCL26-01]
MEQWQFLIQKQGDRSWQALESPNTEIFEGRYRVLARSHLPNTDMEVRVTHFSTEEVPPKRRVQKRSRRTNAEGLMAVIPFTYLKSGLWELRCSGDLMSDMLGQSWQYSVNLQVIPPLPDQPQSATESNVTSNPLPDSSLPPNTQSYWLSTEFSPDQEDAAINEPVNPVWVKGETAEQILQNLIDLALPTTESLLPEEIVEDEPIQQPSLPLSLTLDRETYITRWGHLLTIYGQVELAADSQLAKIEHLYNLELKIELRSPQRSELLTQIRQSLADKSLPLTIRSVIDIPADCESKLILADISLSGAVANSGEVTLLANQSFTITADVADLLAVTHPSPATPVNEPRETAPDVPTPSIDLGLFNLVKTPPTSAPIFPSVTTPIPEQIDSSLFQKTADIRIPQLPKLPENPIDTSVPPDLVTEPALEIISPEQEETTVPLTPAPINLEQLLIKQKRSRILGSTLPYLKPLSTLPSPDEIAASAVTEELKPLPTSLSPEEITTSPVTDELNPLVEETSPQVALPLTPQEDKLEDALDTLPTQADVVSAPTETTELTASAPVADVSDRFITEKSVTPVSPYSSPLIRKWMQSQGYSVPEVFPQTDHEQITPEAPPTPISPTFDDDLPTQQITPEEPPTSISPNPDDDLPTQQITPEEPHTPTLSRETGDEETSFSSQEMVIAAENQETTELDTVSLEPETPTPIPETWLTQEIVVDDGESEPEQQTTNKFVAEDQQAIAPPGIQEPLPIPQLYVPEGELVAGKLIRVRVELPQVAPQVVIKLWVEDCQTRWLLDGPHLLTDLLPNSSGNLEVMTQLNIPFGCLEIRLEAIALNTVTQQESHKVTVVKTVIPPDLPDVTLNDLLGL